jgi:hypothetical protein
MNFYKRCPHPALQSYIHHYAVVEFGKPDCWSDLTIVPPGCAVLAIVVGDKKVWIEDGEGPTHYWDFLNFIGQVTHNKNLKIFGPQKLIYVVFQPYGAYRILGVDQQHCIDTGKRT